MYSWEDLLDFETEECVVFYLLSEQGSAPLLLPLLWSFLSTGDELQLLSPGRICLLLQNH